MQQLDQSTQLGATARNAAQPARPLINPLVETDVIDDFVPAIEIAPGEPAADRPPAGTSGSFPSPQGDDRRNAPAARFHVIDDFVPAIEIAPGEPAADRPPAGTSGSFPSPQGDDRRNAPAAQFHVIDDFVPAIEIAPGEPAADRPPAGTSGSFPSPQGDDRRNAPAARFQPPARQMQNHASHQADAAAASWGRLPALSLLSAFGLLLVALANNGARVGAAGADVLFWAGLLLLFVPAAVRLIAPNADRPERIGLVALVGMGLYLVKLLHSPLSFTFSDELQHWRTAGDIIESGYLFAENPLLPVSPLYPGLESITVALADLSGISLFAAGVVVLGAARLVGMLALFLFYEQVGRSARLAGTAALLYVANPNYLFFDAQFAYESLALPLTLLALFAAARRSLSPDSAAVGLTLISLLGLAAVVITHHVTTYALLAFLAVWALIASLRVHDRRAESHPRGLALLGLVASLTWLVYAATLTAKYLFPQLAGSLTQLIQLIAGEAVGRELFRSPAGQFSPLWERVTGYTAVVLILVGLPFGLRRLWQNQRDNPLALTLAAGALAYPISLAMRLTERGAEASNRGAAFLFVAIAFVLASWLVEQPFGMRLGPKWLPAACAWATIIFLGGVAVGWPPPWARMPGPYLPAADSRSIEREGLAAAEWTRALLGPDNRLIADRTNRLLMGAYGEQRPVTGYADKVQISQVFLAPQLGPAERQILRAGRVRYVVVDRRLSYGLPSAGVYFERGEVPDNLHSAPINPAVLAKFDTLADVSRLFDSGDLVIYDVAGLR